jgi:S-phase kinase-associated protein 1
MSKTLSLNSSDNVKVTIDSKSAERSVLLKGLLQDYSDENDIPMPDIKGDILKKCVEYMTHYKDTEPKDIPRPLPSPNLLDVTDEWDVNFISGIDLDSVFEIINASNYLDLKSLLDLSCSRIASIMKGKTAEEIRNIFNLDNDLTEDEIKEFEEYQI